MIRDDSYAKAVIKEAITKQEFINKELDRQKYDPTVSMSKTKRFLFMRKFCNKELENCLIETIVKKFPLTLASTLNIGTIMTSENDNREYIVKEVKGKGVSVYKKWVLKK